MARTCRLCGAPNSTCGPSHGANAVTFTTREKGISMGKLSNYTYKNQDGYEVALRLTEADAKKRGLTKANASDKPAKKAAATPANKSRTAENKG